MTLDTTEAIIGICTTAVAAIFWYLKNDFDNKRSLLDEKLKNIEGENNKLSEQIKEFEKHDIETVESNNKYLRNQIREYEEYGADILFSRNAIENELKKITTILNAQSGTVYLPYPDINNPQGLKIASIIPYDVHTSKLYKQLTPFSSIAGSVFINNAPIITQNANSTSQFSKIADMISGYETTAMLTVPVNHDNKVIAVVQLLNPSGKQFSESDISLAVKNVSNAEGMAEKISNFIKIPKWQNILHSKETYQEEIILFCDLTSSTTLFRELNIESTFAHINRFFELVSNIALQHGAIIDKYMGDGVLFRFVGKNASDIIDAAELIERNFNKLKKEWLQESQLFSSIFIRIGIANGLVVKRIVGHPQYQAIGIYGQAVNISVNLCDVAPRDRNVIIVSDTFKDLLDDENISNIKATEVHDIGKAGSYNKNSTAYILGEG